MVRLSADRRSDKDSVIGPYRKLLAILSPTERRRGLAVLAMVIMMAALETIGVASVMPFLAVLGNPELVKENAVLFYIYNQFGYDSVDDFITVLGFLAFAIIMVSAVFRSVTHYALNRFIEMRRHSISKRLLETYLRQPYEYFLNRHTGDMAKNILSEVDQLIQNVIRPSMQMIAYSLVLAFMITLLIVVDPSLAFGVTVIVGGLYALIFGVVRGLLGRVGRYRVQANRERYTVAAESLSGIKDIKLLGREQSYLSKFQGPSYRQARYQALNQTLGDVPKYLVEAVAFGGVIVLIIYLLLLHGGTESSAVGRMLPILGLYAFAGYRMLPAAQRVYSGVARMRFGASVIDAIHNDLVYRDQLASIDPASPKAITPSRSIDLREVSYRYPGAPHEALKRINLHVPVGASVGIIGSSGSGKTTLVDVLLGLLRPTAGGIFVDDIEISDAIVRDWQRSIGYVPQEIFLTDTSIAENIAFGISRDQIDTDQVVRCARMARVHEFIENTLPEGYDTLVGERGVRLSGGQRQRIGIARALYHDPHVLVFDEATSALDMSTEGEVMDAIESLAGVKTIVLIAHRLATVQKCAQIVEMRHGEIVR